MDSTVDRPLPGRARELATFESALDVAGASTRAAVQATMHVVVEGEPGSGRTAVLRAAAALAAARGFQVAWTRGRPGERGYPLGVARQLIGPLLTRAPESVQVTLPPGVVTPDAPIPASIDPETMYGLYRLIVRLAAGRPLFVVVDDLQWCDAASLRWLGQLARRSARVPLLLAFARTTGLGDDLLLDELTGSFAQLHLRPLIECEVAEVVRQPMGPFSAACHAATGGNPFLLTALLDDLAEGGHDTADVVAGYTGPATGRWVRSRIRQADPHAAQNAERIARAVAILGDGAEPDLVARQAGLGIAPATEAADALVRSQLLRAGRTLNFRRPIVRNAVLHEMSETERQVAHARAARLLYARGRRTALVVDHLLATGPIGDVWSVPVLRESARAALAAGVGGLAVVQLRKALEATPYGPEHLDILVELGEAEQRTDVAAAVAHLTEAFESAADPRSAARVAEHLAAATCEGEDAKAAIGVLDRAIAGLDLDSHPRNADLVADLDILALGISARVTSLACAHRIERLQARAAARPGAARAIAGIIAYRLSAACRSRRQSVARAREVLALGPPEAMRDFFAYRNAALALCRAGELDLARRCADTLIEHGRALNQPIFVASGHGLRGWLALQYGRLANVIDECRIATDVHARLMPDAGPHAAKMYMIDAYLDLGRLEEAARLLTRIGLLGGDHPAPYWAVFSLESRGRYRMLRGDPEGALADYLEAGRQLVDFGVINPVSGSWRSSAALVLHGLGDTGKAIRLATEEVTLARSWGVAAPLGVALRAIGLIRRDMAALEESVDVLAGSPARLEYARSLHELGMVRLASRHRDEARRLLRDAYVLALDCGAAPLVARIAETLAEAGARRPRPRPTGVAALTAQERRIAELAAAGATNREIAETLFLIQRTVETHLTSVYRKLGIDGRPTLAAALGA